MSTFKDVAKLDSSYKKFKLAVEKGVFTIERDKLLDEIEQMHSLRRVRLLKSKTVMRKALTELVDATLENQAFRSRATEIKMLCYRKQSKLEENLETLTSYLTVKYRSELAEDYKTITERKGAVVELLSFANKCVKDAETVTELADLLIEDCNQASWTLKHVQELIETHMKTNH